MKNTNQNGSGDGPWIPSNEEWLNAQVEIDNYLAQKKRRRLWLFFLFGFLLIGGGSAYFLGVNTSIFEGSGVENKTEYAKNEYQDGVISNTPESSELKKNQTEEAKIDEVAQEQLNSQINTSESINQQSTENQTTSQDAVVSNMKGNGENSIIQKEELTPGNEIVSTSSASTPMMASQERKVIAEDNEDSSEKVNKDEKELKNNESLTRDEVATTMPLVTLMEGVVINSSWDISRPNAFEYDDEVSSKAPPFKWNPTVGFSSMAFLNQEISKSQIGVQAFAGLEITYKKKWVLDTRLKGRLLASDFGASNVIKQEKASLGESYDRWTITPKQLYQAGVQMGLSYAPNNKHQIGVFGTMYRTLGVVGNVDFYRYDALQDKINKQGEEISSLGKRWIKDHNIQKWQGEIGLNYTRPIYRNMYFESSVVYRLNQGNFWTSDLGGEEQFLELTDPWPAFGIQIGIKWKL